jgi:hypothetical protein
MNSLKHLAMVAVLLAIGMPSYSATIWCNGSISDVLMYKGGGLMVNPSFRNDWIVICNTVEMFNDVDPMVCWGWYSLVMTAKKENKQVTIYYSHPNAADCATLPTYSSSVPPEYVRLKP